MRSSIFAHLVKLFNISVASRVFYSSALIVALMSLALFLVLKGALERDIQAINDKENVQKIEHVVSEFEKEQDRLLSLANSVIRDRVVVENILGLGESLGGRRWLSRYIETATLLHRVDSVTFWGPNGGLVAATESIIGNMGFVLSNFDDGSKRYPRSGIVDVGGGIWIVSTAPINRSGEHHGLFQFAKNMDRFPGVGAVVLEKDNQPGIEFMELGIQTASGEELYLRLDRSAQQAVSSLTINSYLGLFIFFMAFIVTLFLWGLVRLSTRPLSGIQSAMKRVSKGQLAPLDLGSSCGEVNSIQKSFNIMQRELRELKDLEKAFRDKKNLIMLGRLGSRISHDINNPLSVIRSVSSLAMFNSTHDGSSCLVSDMEKIYRKSSQCLAITQAMLDLDRSKSIESEKIEFCEYLGRYLKTRKEESEHFEFELNLSEVCPIAVVGHNELLQVVLDNIVDNALEANGGRIIQFDVEVLRKYLCVRVRDNGIGFPVSDGNADVFDLFFTTKAEGHGMGLANSLSIVNALGGTIEITEPRCGEISIFLLLMGSGE